MAIDKKENVYKRVLEHVFFDEEFCAYKDGKDVVAFAKSDLERAADVLGVDPKNLPDALYSMRYRTPLPARIVETQPKGKEWIIEGAGKGFTDYVSFR